MIFNMSPEDEAYYLSRGLYNKNGSMDQVPFQLIVKYRKFPLPVLGERNFSRKHHIIFQNYQV